MRDRYFVLFVELYSPVYDHGQTYTVTVDRAKSTRWLRVALGHVTLGHVSITATAHLSGFPVVDFRIPEIEEETDKTKGKSQKPKINRTTKESITSAF